MKYIWSGQIHEEFIRAGFSTAAGFNCLSKLIGKQTEPEILN